MPFRIRSSPAGYPIKPPITAEELGAAIDFPTHLGDYTNPHKVTAKQVFALGGIPSGTAFPSTPANYTLFYRTDLKKLFIYLP